MKKQLVAKRAFMNPSYKDRALVLKTSEETCGAYSLGELGVYPGGGDFPHVHTGFEETFTAVKAVLGVMPESKGIPCIPGKPLPYSGIHCTIFLMMGGKK